MAWLEAGVGLLSLFGGNKRNTGSGSTAAPVYDQTTGSTDLSNLTASEKTKGSSTEKTNSTGTVSGVSSSAGTTNAVGTTTQQEKQQTSNFDTKRMGELNALLSGTVGSSSAQMGQDAIGLQLTRLLGQSGDVLDPAAYARSIRNDAKVGIRGQLESDVNSLASQVGSTGQSNSMAALLGSRMNSDATRELSGIESQARMAAEGLNMQNRDSITSGIGGLATAGTSSLVGLIQSLSGATQTSVGDVKGTTVSKENTTSADKMNQTEKTSGSTAGTTTSNTTGSQKNLTTGVTDVDNHPVTDGQGALLADLLKKLGLATPAPAAPAPAPAPAPVPNHPPGWTGGR